MRTLSLCLVLLLVGLSAHACPKRHGDASLTFDDVMEDFGSLLLNADFVVLHGQQDSNSVSNEQMQTAIEGINGAIECAQTVLNNHDLLPLKADELTGSAREKYLNLLYSDMRDFLAGLQTYADRFRALLPSEPAARDFGPAAAQRDAVSDLANKAHDDLR